MNLSLLFQELADRGCGESGMILPTSGLEAWRQLLFGKLENVPTENWRFELTDDYER